MQERYEIVAPHSMHCMGKSGMAHYIERVCVHVSNEQTARGVTSESHFTVCYTLKLSLQLSKLTVTCFCFVYCGCRLVGEVYEIRAIVEQLNNKLTDIEGSMSSLHGTRLALERDLNIKNNSIHVDRDLCLSWRKSFDMKPRSAVTY
jgi:hypothetical protein